MEEGSRRLRPKEGLQTYVCMHMHVRVCACAYVHMHMRPKEGLQTFAVEMRAWARAIISIAKVC